MLTNRIAGITSICKGSYLHMIDIYLVLAGRLSYISTSSHAAVFQAVAPKRSDQRIPIR